jgi:predicted metal-dependent HD superfamily phosphohydrolase
MRLSPAQHEELVAHWRALCAQLGLAGAAATGMGETLIHTWSRWPRRYHDATHLLACVRHAGEVAPHCDDPQAVALALWFHDAVYWPWARNNERRSADWARRFILGCGLPGERAGELARRVEQHIMATQHHDGALTGDDRWVVDIDLAILGQPPHVYDLFEEGVRHEYRWVPHSAYVAGRGKVLRSFLDRPRLYATDLFHDRYEATARANLQRALTALQGAGA